MKFRVAIPLLLAVVMVACVRASAEPDKPSREQLLARADVAQGEKCAELCIDAAQNLVEYSNELFTNGEVDKAQTAMQDAAKYARKATDGSIQANKRQKKTEIALRKLAKRMRDINQTLAIDDRAEVEKAIANVEKMRTDLLMSLFSKE